LKKKKEIEKKKKKKKKKKGGIAGWLEPPFDQKWGGRTTPFLAKGWPNRPYGGGRSHPERPKKKKKKKKNEKMGLAGPPPRAWGWIRNTTCNTPSPLRLGLSPFFFINKIFANIHKVYQST
jgi:hypothetical protein